MLLLLRLLLSESLSPLSQLQLSLFISLSFMGRGWSPAPGWLVTASSTMWSLNLISGSRVFFVVFTITQLPDWSTLWSSPKKAATLQKYLVQTFIFLSTFHTCEPSFCDKKTCAETCDEFSWNL